MSSASGLSARDGFLFAQYATQKEMTKLVRGRFDTTLLIPSVNTLTYLAFKNEEYSP